MKHKGTYESIIVKYIPSQYFGGNRGLSFKAISAYTPLVIPSLVQSSFRTTGVLGKLADLLRQYVPVYVMLVRSRYLDLEP